MNQTFNSQNKIIKQTKENYFFYLYKRNEFITK